jgi:ankyrin repeat protein
METAVGTNLIDAATAGAELTEEQLQLAQFLLEQMVAQGWDVNQQDSTGSTYVGKVIYRGQYPIAEMLLEAGASLDIPNTSDETNLMAFARVGWVEQVRFLVTHGANLDYQGIWGISALHYAVDDNVYQEPGTPVEVVKILLEAGATPDLQNDLGETPLDIAVLKGHDELAQLLQEAVARAGD